MKKLGSIFVVIAILLLIIITTQIEQSILADDAKPVQVSGEFIFTEGPAADRRGNVYFTDQPNNRIMKWCIDGVITTCIEESSRSNGLYFDKEGKLLACADENNQLLSIDLQTKEVEVLIKNYEGHKLNGPNDLWIDDNGGIYFTDPYYKRDYWTNPEKELESEDVYYLSPDRKSLRIVEDELVKPNGIIGSPDGNTLYVADIGDSKTYSYHISSDGSLSNRQLFCNMGSDGMTIDYKGNVYLTNKGVFVFNRKGEQIEHIEIDEEWTANVTFGGAEFKTLFITAMNSVYTVDMNVKGVRY